MANNGYTPTEARIVAVLADGQPHTREELEETIGNPLNCRQTLNTHISAIRKKLRPRGQDIIGEYVRRQCHYRHVILYRPSSQE